MKTRLLTVLGILLILAVSAVAAPKGAEEILREAQAKGKVAKKNVLVMFDASW